MPIIQAVERALKILDLFDEFDKELKITEISDRMGLHKSTVHSLLKTLQQHHYIEQNQENGKYRLGLKLFERGNYVIQSMDLRKLASDSLQRLSKESGKTVHLVVLDGREGIYIDKVESATATVLYSRIGRRVPIHSSAVGKALVAFKSLEEIEKLIEDYHFKQQTPKTISNKEEFLKEIELIQKQGYAVDNEENEPGVFCVALPIKDHTGQVIAAISMSTTATRVAEEGLEKPVEMLTVTSKEISKKLGFGFSK
ncbi:IclR family transcriptional regulator [Bacillus alkalicellulosilyticus]|uniref:IclR family transcriptional regulator n=1 Tax=Alkalihalobacterium alkalicellulosilyticum TaxID=1912214 RepID=UPI000998B968|nr:IclR family transcriptional regulator [Bacillus alkalicellulosilyticus]